MFYYSPSLMSGKPNLKLHLVLITNLVSVMNILSEEIKRNIIIDNDIEANISLIINHPLDDKNYISFTKPFIK